MFYKKITAEISAGHFKNKPETKILRRTEFSVLKICNYNAIRSFQLNSIKSFLSDQKATKTALAVCSVVIIFLQEVKSVISAGCGESKISSTSSRHQMHSKTEI